MSDEILYASAIYMHHFFGYDGYTLDYEIALRMLRRLDKSLHREVALSLIHISEPTRPY